MMVVGNQWYWVHTSMDSSLYVYAVREHELMVGDLRLLHTSQCMLVDCVCVHYAYGAVSMQCIALL